ncbi:MAG: toll/interleukin-1 receptor domain-containing protein [Pirellulales bacterium]|nr:toll/interleukin-1 receptor domain-containing protein [Pirellulales bacterium]
MRHLFMAHASEDFGLVRTIADELERKGIRCWYYERDAIEGRSYLPQIRDAIRDSVAMVVIVSKDSLLSHDVTKEIEIGYRSRKQQIPVAVQVEYDQVASSAPMWDTAFGTTVYIRNEQDSTTLVDKLVAALSGQARADARLSPPVSRALTPKPRRRPLSLGSTPPWASDGTQVDVSLFDDMVFRTPSVDQYLVSDQLLFVSGAKGIGKTLLLRYKRHRLTELHLRPGVQGAHADVLFIPSDRPYVDMMNDLPSTTKNYIEFFSSVRDSKRLWAFSIRFSIISHKRSAAAELLRHLPSDFPSALRIWLESKSVEPSVVFKQLVIMPVTRVNKILDVLEGPLDFVLRNINCGVFVFIDKVDQGVSALPREAWSAVQGGLLEAAWDCSSTNAHVKVFGTIRAEAFANYSSPIKANIAGAVLSLRYSSEDLRSLIDALAGVYEGVGFESFVDRKTVQNTRAGIVENSFSYLLRHTVGRPRDLVRLCSALSEEGAHVTEGRYRAVVNDTAASQVVETLFTEMSPFLDCLREGRDRARFFRMLPYNVLTRQEMVQIVAEFGGTPVSGLGEVELVGDNPFMELWYCGLIGTVDEDAVQGVQVQRFKQPDESFHFGVRSLPVSPYYLLHPSLQSNVKYMRAADGYRVFKYVVVGNGYPWCRYSPLLVNLQRELFGVRLVEPELCDAIEAALPCIHAAWTEDRDIVEHMSDAEWKQFGQLVASDAVSKHDSLVMALKDVWANWGEDGKVKVTTYGLHRLRTQR